MLRTIHSKAVAVLILLGTLLTVALISRMGLRIMVNRLILRLIDLPQAPRRLTAQALELYGWNCAFMGATAASVAWIAIILLALIVATLIRRVRP